MYFFVGDFCVEYLGGQLRQSGGRMDGEDPGPRANSFNGLVGC